MRARISACLVLTCLCCLTTASCRGAEPGEPGDPLRAERELTLPLSELSGLAVRRVGDAIELLAVGDQDRALLAVPLAGGVPDVGQARRIALPLPAGESGSQLEGVAVDDEGRVWVLVEHGEVYVYMIDGDDPDGGARELWHRPIVFSPRHPLAEPWQSDPNKRAEGIAIVGRRIFVVKQSEPVALIELTQDGDRLLALLAHELPDLEQASDLVAHAGGLWVVSAASGTLCALAVPGEKGPDGPLSCQRAWRLPEALGRGATRWEALAFLPDGRPVVGVDRKKLDRPNAAVLPRL